VFTLIALWVIPAVVAGVVGWLIFRNRIKGVYFSIITQAALMVFFHFFNGQQKLFDGTNGLKTSTSELFGQLVGSPACRPGSTGSRWFCCPWPSSSVATSPAVDSVMP
jgi:urea transport system permease protein